MVKAFQILPWAVGENMKNIIITSIVAIVVSTLSAPAQASAEFSQGVALFNAHNYKAAVETLRTSVSRAESANPLAHYYLGNALMQLHYFQQAKVEFEKCLALNPDAKLAEFCQTALVRMPQSRGCGSSVALNLTEAKAVEKPAQQSAQPAANLPKPVKAAVGPTADEVSEWTVDQQADYAFKAYKTQAQLERQLELARKNLIEVRTSIPNARTYGQSEDSMQSRRRQDGQFVQIYEQSVRECADALEQAEAVSEICKLALGE